MRKTTAMEELFTSPSSELSLPLCTVSELQAPSSSSSLDDDSSCQKEGKIQHINSTFLSYTRAIGSARRVPGWTLTPDPLADLRNLLASGMTSGFFFRKDLATSSSPSPSLSEEEPGRTQSGDELHRCLQCRHIVITLQTLKCSSMKSRAMPQQLRAQSTVNSFI